jgi:hypothetical protein
MHLRHLISGLLLLALPVLCSGQNRRLISFLQGPGSYVLTDGMAGDGRLSFTNHKKSVLYVSTALGQAQYPAAAVSAFTINGHRLVPQGRFDFYFFGGLGGQEYHADNAFIEYADTTGTLQLALYYTSVMLGANADVYYTQLLLRRRGDKEFVMGPNNFRKWDKSYRQELADELGPWPELQQAVRSGAATFLNFPEYVQRANLQSR